VRHKRSFYIRRDGRADGDGDSPDARPPPEADALWTARAIAANMADGVAVIRASDGVIIFTNPSWDAMFGYAEGELEGRHIAVVNAPTGQTPEERANEIATALERTGHWRGAVRNMRKDGSDLWCDATVSEFNHPEQGPVWLSVQRETTDRIAAVEELRAAKDRYQDAFERTPVPTALLTNDERVVDVNDAFCSLTGYDGDELVGRPLADITHPDDAASDAAERRLVGKAGEQVPVRLNGLVLTATGPARERPTPPGSPAGRAGDP
jgi:PAS domain S-box-containing protein